jgi:membrane fusion protein (multidrug efflux system)
MTQRTTFAAVFLLAATMLVSGCNRGKASDGNDKEGKDKPAAEAMIPVESALAKRAPIVANYSGTATLEADREAQVVAKTSGVLLKLMVEEGAKVHAGQVLAQLDPERPRLQVAQAEANLKRLQNDYNRSQDMYAKKLVSSEAYDKIKFDLETQKAAYDLARLELSYTNITAPIDGVLSQRMVKEGNLIQLNAPLFRIDDFDPLLAVLNVPERELTTLKPGLPVKMEVDALPGKAFEGKVQRIAPVVDSKTGTFRVTCEFSDKSDTLKSGMFGRVDVVYAERADALTIPREALIEEDGDTAVFVIETETKKDIAAAAAKDADGKVVPVADTKETKPAAKDDKAKDAKPAGPALVVHRRAVKVGYASGNLVEIREGLKDGDRVVTVGRAALREGTKVQVLEAKP